MLAQYNYINVILQRFLFNDFKSFYYCHVSGFSKVFYRAMHFSAKRDCITCRLSVRPSVCLSVCDVGEL